MEIRSQLRRQKDHELTPTCKKRKRKSRWGKKVAMNSLDFHLILKHDYNFFFLIFSFPFLDLIRNLKLFIYKMRTIMQSGARYLSRPARRCASTLIVNDGEILSPSTLSCITAAQQIGHADIHVLCQPSASAGCAGAAGVSKVLESDMGNLAENVVSELGERPLMNLDRP